MLIDARMKPQYPKEVLVDETTKNLVTTKWFKYFRSLIADNLVHDVTYMVVTDIQLVEEAPSGAFVRTDQQIDNRQGSTGRTTQTVSSVGTQLKYRTRIVSTANKVNLKYEEAHGPLASGIARSLSGLF